MTLNEIGRIDAGNVGRSVRSDISQIRIAVRLKTCVYTLGEKTLRESDINQKEVLDILPSKTL